ncbi:MAG: RecX family transcriptional regulator [Nitrospirae bacterium]|nr:RecX family transcriptional regulator [Fimbriimonadaceae bacterium]
MTPLAQALKDAERLLAHRDRFESDVAGRLEAKGHPSEVVGEAVAWLRERRLLDDRRTLQAHLASPAMQRRDTEAARARLLALGAPEALVEEALGHRGGHDLDALEETVRTKYGKPTDRARAARFLARAGLETDTIGAMLDRVFGEEDAWTSSGP